MAKGTGRYPILLCVVIFLILAACHNRNIFTDSVSMPDHMWALENEAVFSPGITDTLVSTNIFFNIRTGSSYPYRNIFLFVSTTSPAGKTITDTLQYMLADEKGKWFGRGTGDIHELRLPFKTGVYFPVKGIYTFRICHGMRSETLKGVYDFGLRIEKSIK
jgi:gliding motility-associated lipoprotein GldH